MWIPVNAELKARDNLILNDLMQNLEINDESSSCSISKNGICDLNLSLETEKIRDDGDMTDPTKKMLDVDDNSSFVSENSYVYLPNIKMDKREVISKPKNEYKSSKQIPVDCFYNTASSQDLSNNRIISTFNQTISNTSKTGSENRFKCELKPAYIVNHSHENLHPQPLNYSLSSHIQNHCFPSKVPNYICHPPFIPVRIPLYYSNQNIPFNSFYENSITTNQISPINTSSPMYSTNFTHQGPAFYNNNCNSFESHNNFAAIRQIYCTSARTDSQQCIQAQKKVISKNQKSYIMDSSFESLEGNEVDAVCLKQGLNSKDEEAQLEKFNDIADFITKCKDHQGFINSKRGSHYLKKLLPKADSDKIGLLLNIILPFSHALMENCSGNYFCQELFRMLNESQRKLIWQTIRNKIGEFGVHEYANHCLQTLIELAEGIKEQNEIGVYLHPFYIDLAFNPQGSHIIQKILLKYTDSAKKELVTFIWENFRLLAKDSHGVCVIKKYIMYLKDKSSKHKAEFIKFIGPFIPQLTNDTYAHYSLLCLVDEWKLKDFWQVLDYLRQHFLECSVQKYSSRILEKLLGTANKVRLSH